MYLMESASCPRQGKSYCRRGVGYLKHFWQVELPTDIHEISHVPRSSSVTPRSATAATSLSVTPRVYM